MSALVRLISDPNPILVKELRATFRTNLFVRFLYLSTALVALLVLVVGALVASNDVPPATVGQVLFQLYLGASLLVICLVAPGYASAAITTEREQQTWESLELSGMSASRIVLGKMAASYASIALVLVAVTPVVGIAFLFGGVSPGQVIVGFLSLLVALAPAVAMGLAISARLRSTRLAIVLSTLSFVPLAITGLVVMGMLGEEARTVWGGGTEGPFFYADAFATHIDDPEAWLLLVGVPIYAFGMPVWFLLASAVAAVRPAAEDRARPMKIWAIAMSLTSVPIAVLSVEGWTRSTDAVLTVMMLTGVLLILYGVLFTNEPALPPRSWETRRAGFGPLRRLLAMVGPGAAGTMRFSIVLSIVTAVAVTGAVVVALAAHGTPWHSRAARASIVLGTGGLCLAVFAASLGAYLRVALGNGLAARVLTLAVLVAAAVLPFLGLLLMDVDAFERNEIPDVLTISSVYPVLLAVQVMQETSYSILPSPEVSMGPLVVTVLIYGGMAIVFAVLLEARVARARREAVQRYARFGAPEPPSAEPPPEAG